MNKKFLNLNINDKNSLLKACDYLHDAYLDISQTNFDQLNGTWEGYFERDFFEDKSKIIEEKKIMVFNKVTFPVVRTILSLKNISSYEIDDKEIIHRYCFNECKIKDNLFRFFFCENMKMVFTFKDNPLGNLKDIELLEEKRSLYSLRSFFHK